MSVAGKADEDFTFRGWEGNFSRNMNILLQQAELAR
jgi:hypothetical protein